MKRETHPNVHVITYHVKKRVSDSMIEMFDSKNWRGLDAADADTGGLLGFLKRLFLGNTMGKYLEKENRSRLAIGDLIDSIFAVDGVVSVSTGQYEIRIEKAEAFDWAEIEPAVIEALNRHGYGDEVAQEPKSA